MAQHVEMTFHTRFMLGWLDRFVTIYKSATVYEESRPWT
jgi:hypothetical protein